MGIGLNTNALGKIRTRKKSEFETVERGAMVGTEEVIRHLWTQCRNGMIEIMGGKIGDWEKTVAGNWVRSMEDGVVVAFIVATPRGFCCYPDKEGNGFRTPGFWSSPEAAECVDRALHGFGWFESWPTGLPVLPE